MGKRREHKTKDTDATVMGVAWYRPEQWDRLLEISSDRAELEDTYDEWKAVAEGNLGNLAQHGYKLCKVEIDVEELFNWCNSQKRAVDGDARTEFTVMKLRESNQERLQKH
jgi:hypothetical protein